MKKGKRIVLKIFAGLAIVFAICFALYILYIYHIPAIFVYFGPDVQELRTRLLYETDHQALLDACREISKQVARGDLKKNQYWIRQDRDPETSYFPEVILDLEPKYVYIDQEGRVMVEMLARVLHFGVYAYPEDYEYEGPISNYGDKELIPGLWYYDDGYRHNPEYDKRIEALLQKRK